MIKIGPFPTNAPWGSSAIQTWLEKLRKFYNYFVPPSTSTSTYLRDDLTWAYPATAYVLASDESTGADTDPISLTGLAWDYEANAKYVFRIVGNVSPDAATSGCGFQLLIT